MKRFANIAETVAQPCRIFGTALRPFCLGHHLLFARLRLPYADNPGALGSVRDFMLAVFICAHSHEENLAGLGNGEWEQAREKWLKVVAKSKPDVTAARAVFQQHLTDGYRIAPVWRHVSGSSVEMTSPWEQLLKCRLVAAGFALTDVLNGYLPERWYDYFTVIELKQAETCSAKDWRKIFYTREDAIEDALAEREEVAT